MSSSEHVRFAVAKRLGIVTLDRPRAINALDPGMIAAIHLRLEAWATDPAIKAVLIEGAGEKGFCAGGDVRAARTMLLAGDQEGANAYFAAEYALDGLVARYPKPVIACQHGIVMGGGIGLSAHARLRIAVEGARFAMPETAIGFFCDVGASWPLREADAGTALAFVLAGLPVGPDAAAALNLTDRITTPDRWPDLRTSIIDAATGTNAVNTIEEVIHATTRAPVEGRHEPDPEWAAFATLPTAAFIPALAERIKAPLTMQDETIASRCPASLVANHVRLSTARAAGSIDEVLAGDTRLAAYLSSRDDFVEGVRTVLIDKDNAPAWNPALLSEIDPEPIRSVLAGT